MHMLIVYTQKHDKFVTKINKKLAVSRYCRCFLRFITVRWNAYNWKNIEEIYIIMSYLCLSQNDLSVIFRFGLMFRNMVYNMQNILIR